MNVYVLQWVEFLGDGEIQSSIVLELDFNLGFLESDYGDNTKQVIYASKEDIAKSCRPFTMRKSSEDSRWCELTKIGEL